jgi:hypothetical protein
MKKEIYKSIYLNLMYIYCNKLKKRIRNNSEVDFYYLYFIEKFIPVLSKISPEDGDDITSAMLNKFIDERW